MSITPRLFKLFFLSIYVFAVFFLMGCAATGKMVLTPNTPIPNMSQANSVALLVIESSKESAGALSRLPIVDMISVGGGSEKEALPYKVTLDIVSCNDYRVRHLISLSLPSDGQIVHWMWGKGLTCGEVDNPSLLRNPVGVFVFKLKLKLTPIPGKVVYAGHIKTHMRGRKSDAEPRAGPAVPVLDQAVTGFYSSTFDVTVADMFDEDMAMFHEKFPSLRQYETIKSIAVQQDL